MHLPSSHSLGTPAGALFASGRRTLPLCAYKKSSIGDWLRLFTRLRGSVFIPGHLLPFAFRREL